MTSFFRAIRSYFKTDYDGRYLALLLREIAVHEPASMAALLDIASIKSKSAMWSDIKADLRSRLLSIKCEVTFAKGRRADLALLSGRELRLLFEIKEYDDINPKNDKQIDDYLKEASRGLGFIYVYRFSPQQEYYQRLLAAQHSGKPVATLSYDEIYRVLSKQGAPIANLLCKYLEDIGVGVYRALDQTERKHLSFLLVQLLGFPHKTGMGKLQSQSAAESIPLYFETFLGNAEVIGEAIRRSNIDLFPKSFGRRFSVSPNVNYPKLREALNRKVRRKEKLEVDSLGSHYVESGIVFFSAIGSPKVPRKASNEWYHLEVGYAFEIERGSGEVRSYLYGLIEGSGISDNPEVFKPFSKRFPSEEVALMKMGKILAELQKEVLEFPLTPAARKAFQRLQEPTQ